MMQRMSDYVFRLIQPYIKDEAGSSEVYRYGIEIAIYTVLSTLGLILTGVLFQRPLETIIIITIYYANQTFGGGYHASTHLKCFFMMAVFLAIGLLLCSISLPLLLLFLFTSLSFVILFRFPLALHENKNYLKYKETMLIFRVHILNCLELSIGIALFYFTDVRWIQVYVIGLTYSAVSRLAAHFHISKV